MMQTQFNPLLVTLSVLVAIFASYVALNLAQNLSLTKGRGQIWWLTCGALAMGSGIWSMHFVGMLAFEMPGMEMAYDIPLMVLSVVVAIGASALAFFIVSRPAVTVSSIVSGGIAMAAAIAGMHYTGMIAATFVHDHNGTKIESSNLLVTDALTVVVIAATLLILGLSLVGSIGQRLWNARRRKDTELLDESEERVRQLRTVTNAVPVLIAQLNRDEIFVFANDPFCRWFNLKFEEVIGRSMKEVVGERYLDIRSMVQDVLSGRDATYERSSIFDGQRVTMEVSYLADRNSRGGVEGFLIVAKDITKHKEIEAELKSAKDAAESANETKSSFLANMSHEIRTPLGAVLGFSELLVSENLTPADKQNTLEIIKRNGQLLSNIINDILDLSKVEAGKLELERVEVPFSEIMKEIGSVLSLEASAKGIDLTVTSNGLIPSHIHTDPLRLRQILLNIVGNAIKFTTRGAVNVDVRLVQMGAQFKLAFVIKDTGAGISQEQGERLFQPFTQADASTTRKFGGTGLGLVLSRKLARALGGDVVLSNTELGKGSTFVLTIDPGTSDQLLFRSTGSEPTNVTHIRSERAVDLKSLRVLLVEDSPDNQQLIKRVLGFAGAEVTVANNGKEGVNLALNREFDVVLMDLQMPIMDGYQAIEVLRQSGFAKPVIALTAHALKEERERSLASGFNDHITKPVDNKLLLRRLSSFSSTQSSSSANSTS